MIFSIFSQSHQLWHQSPCPPGCRPSVTSRPKTDSHNLIHEMPQLSEHTYDSRAKKKNVSMHIKIVPVSLSVFDCFTCRPEILLVNMMSCHINHTLLCKFTPSGLTETFIVMYEWIFLLYARDYIFYLKDGTNIIMDIYVFNVFII